MSLSSCSETQTFHNRPWDHKLPLSPIELVSTGDISAVVVESFCCIVYCHHRLKRQENTNTNKVEKLTEEET